MNKIYLILYYGFLRHLPSTSMPFGIVSNNLRSLIASRLFLFAGENIVVKRGAYFGKGNLIKMGDRSQIGEDARIEHDTVIGADVMMGLQVLVLSTRHAYADIDEPMISQGYEQRKPVVIGDDVWLGGRAIVLPGVNIGSHSIVGAGSVVTKNIPPYSIVAGVPAKVVRDRRTTRCGET
jgi:maltose O-acetyltransferase